MSKKQSVPVKRHQRRNPKKSGKHWVRKHERLIGIRDKSEVRILGVTHIADVKGVGPKSTEILADRGYTTLDDARLLADRPNVQRKLIEDHGLRTKTLKIILEASEMKKGTTQAEKEAKIKEMVEGIHQYRAKWEAKEAERKGKEVQFKSKTGRPPKPRQFTIYHVTFAERADSIMQEGFIPRKEKPMGQPFEAAIAGAYGFPTKGQAEQSIYSACDMLHEMDFAIRRKQFAIIKITVPVNKQWEPRLWPDEDWSKNQEDWVRYKRQGASAVIEGHIPPKYMTRVY